MEPELHYRVRTLLSDLQLAGNKLHSQFYHAQVLILSDGLRGVSTEHCHQEADLCMLRPPLARTRFVTAGKSLGASVYPP